MSYVQILNVISYKYGTKLDLTKFYYELASISLKDSRVRAGVGGDRLVPTTSAPNTKISQVVATMSPNHYSWNINYYTQPDSR